MSETHLETHRVSSLCSAFAHVVTVNFMCHLDWPTGYADIWSDVIPGVTVKVGLIQSVEGWIDQRADPAQSKRDFSCLSLFKLAHGLFFLPSD